MCVVAVRRDRQALQHQVWHRRLGVVVGFGAEREEHQAVEYARRVADVPVLPRVPPEVGGLADARAEEAPPHCRARTLPSEATAQQQSLQVEVEEGCRRQQAHVAEEHNGGALIEKWELGGQPNTRGGAASLGSDGC